MLFNLHLLAKDGNPEIDCIDHLLIIVHCHNISIGPEGCNSGAPFFVFYLLNFNFSLKTKNEKNQEREIEQTCSTEEIQNVIPNTWHSGDEELQKFQRLLARIEPLQTAWLVDDLISRWQTVFQDRNRPLLVGEVEEHVAPLATLGDVNNEHELMNTLEIGATF